MAGLRSHCDPSVRVVLEDNSIELRPGHSALTASALKVEEERRWRSESTEAAAG